VSGPKPVKSVTADDDLRLQRRAVSRSGHGGALVRVLACDRPLSRSTRHPLDGLAAVSLGRAPAQSAALSEEAGGLRLTVGEPDHWMSGAHAQLRVQGGAWVVEDSGSRNGTFLDGVRVESAPLRDGALLEVGRTFFLYREGPEGAFGPGQPLESIPGMQTLHPGLAADLERLARVARRKVPVVLRGESGSGKELLARAVHALGGRRGSFVAVNCGALPAGLVEGELFGHRKGAYSGAVDEQPGLVRAADGGTLFLDEIGDLALPSQAALLRVLQEEEVLPLGAAHPIKLDLRVVTATHRDLEAMAREGSFRDDLRARLAGFSLRLPPLRDRREDLGLLIAANLRRLGEPAASAASFTPDAARALLTSAWPDNVRGLEHALGVAAALAGEAPIGLEHLPAELRSPHGAPAGPRPQRSQQEQALQDRLEALLGAHHGNVAQVARELGKARSQVWRWLRRLDIDPRPFRGTGPA
jgi:hypothetical protein